MVYCIQADNNKIVSSLPGLTADSMVFIHRWKAMVTAVHMDLQMALLCIAQTETVIQKTECTLQAY